MGRFLQVIRYLRISLIPGWYRPSKKTASGVYFTMTTLPSRIKNIRTTLESLTDQSVCPEKIIINIPKISKREGKGYTIPEFIKSNTLVELNVVEEDLGPATKLLPALKKYEARSDVRLIVCDDDEIYGKGVVENYLKYEELSSQSALTLVGWDAPKNNDHHQRTIKFGAIGARPERSVEVSEPTRVDCVQGASTFMVRPSFFENTVFDYADVPKEAFYVDDIYISGRLAQNKIPVHVIPAPFRYARMKVLSHLLHSQTLHRKENKGGHNNNTLYRHFKTFWNSHSK